MSSVLPRPPANLFLQIVPVLGVESLVLRAHVHEKESLIHCFVAPCHILRGSHVALCPAAFGIVLAAGLASAEIGVHGEHLVLAVHLAVGFLLREFV